MEKKVALGIEKKRVKTKTKNKLKTKRTNKNNKKNKKKIKIKEHKIKKKTVICFTTKISPRYLFFIFLFTRLSISNEKSKQKC